MPRGATSRRAQANRDQTPVDEIKDPFTVTTTTNEESAVRELPFEVAISPAPEDHRPDRSSAGRKRIPSPYEPYLPELKGKNWQCQPHDGKVVPYTTSPDGKPKFNTLSSPPKNPDGTPSDVIPSVKDSNARFILRELQKAVKFLNTPKEKGGEELNLGLDVHVTDSHVWFNIRDKQARTDKSTKAPAGGDDSDVEDVDTETDSDDDE